MGVHTLILDDRAVGAETDERMTPLPGLDFGVLDQAAVNASALRFRGNDNVSEHRANRLTDKGYHAQHRFVICEDPATPVGDPFRTFAS
ncbi:MAG: hypothetical protein AAFN27_08240 [Pseudomonadota bacterium]